MEIGLSAVGACRCLLSEKSRRSHLSACHAVYGVVYENRDNVLASVEGMDCLTGPDTGEVAVALVSEHKAVWPQALDSRGNSERPAMCGLLPVYVDVPVGEHGASDGTDTYGLVFHAHLLYDLGDELMHKSM